MKTEDSAFIRGLMSASYLLTHKINIIKVMAELDTSLHTLNNSTSKQKFSFPKTQRFRPQGKILCDSLYQLPSTRASRAASFGKGNKDMGIRNDKFVPPIGTYELGSEFKKDQHRGFSFGSGRDEMELGGPLKQTKLHAFIPGPGRYDSNKSMLDHRASSLKPRLPDNTYNYLKKNPGPGAYQSEQMGKGMYYATSKHKNQTHYKINPGSRLSQIARRSTIDVSPASYNTATLEDINKIGKYPLAKNQNSKARIFDKSPRPALLYKHMVTNPAPGQYGTFSQFG